MIFGKIKTTIEETSTVKRLEMMTYEKLVTIVFSFEGIISPQFFYDQFAYF